MRAELGDGAVQGSPGNLIDGKDATGGNQSRRDGLNLHVRFHIKTPSPIAVADRWRL